MVSGRNEKAKKWKNEQSKRNKAPFSPQKTGEHGFDSQAQNYLKCGAKMFKRDTESSRSGSATKMTASGSYKNVASFFFLRRDLVLIQGLGSSAQFLFRSAKQ